MNRAQKMARFTLIVTLIALILSLIAVAVLYLIVGLPLRRSLAGFAFIALCGFSGLTPILYKKERGKVTFDERDQAIQKNAAFAGFVGAFLFTCFACMIPFFVLGPKASISVTWLPQIWIGTFVTQFIFHSLAILAQYGWREKGSE